MNTKITKSDYISKTKNRTKKIICAKNERQIDSNLPCKFGQFWRKLNFWAPKTPRLDVCSAEMQYESDMKFYAHLYFQHIAHLLCQMATSEGGGICISLVGIGPVYDFSIKSLDDKFSFAPISFKLVSTYVT